MFGQPYCSHLLLENYMVGCQAAQERVINFLLSMSAMVKGRVSTSPQSLYVGEMVSRVEIWYLQKPV
uniref:Uncharacterized protein n=1 Tax=Oryza brachyantha TaxID=4533 RepID=J3L3L3_ORYBR